MFQSITSFLVYLRDWRNGSSIRAREASIENTIGDTKRKALAAKGKKQDRKKREKSTFLSQSTYVGLDVTLRTTLEVMTFLTEKRGYKYLMTARLNQDALEVFWTLNYFITDYVDGTYILHVIYRACSA